MNERKSSHVNEIAVPYKSKTKYLGMIMDTKYTIPDAKHYSKKKSAKFQLIKKYYWLLEKQSKLAIKNTILIYKQILKLIWFYGAPFTGCTKNNNNTIHTFENFLKTW